MRSRTGNSNCGATSAEEVVATEETGRGERGLIRTSLDVVATGVEVAIGEGDDAVLFDWDPEIDTGVKNIRGPRGTDIRLDGR